jgi:hypothetical protein
MTTDPDDPSDSRAGGVLDSRLLHAAAPLDVTLSPAA